MNRRGFLGLLAGIAAVAFVPMRPVSEVVLAPNSYCLPPRGLHHDGHFHLIDSSSRTWQGINTRAYPALTAKIV